MGRRERADRLLVDRGLAPTRARARALVLAGRVYAGNRRVDKAGEELAADAELHVAPGPRWVGRGGLKLAAALDAFELPVAGRDAVDVGASTGGFTHVLLEAGASRVAAVDVGRGQLDWGLRNDPRVFPVEGVNARYLTPAMLPFAPSLAVVDVSFIPLALVLPPVVACLDPASARRDAVALIKPQFEVGRGRVGRGGIVRDPELHRAVLASFVGLAANHGWAVAAVRPSPVLGAEGNREFLAHLLPDGPAADPRAMESVVAAALVSARDPEVEP
jgi:23S rRNA (cytidine1920-2'-O)/16S rRNA (cytidine1409-2'-O)-methyltransferase